MPPRLPRRRRKEPRPHRDRASEMCPQRHWFVENRLSDGGHALRCNTRSSECSSYVQISNDLRPPARNNQPTHRSFASSSNNIDIRIRNCRWRGPDRRLGVCAAGVLSADRQSVAVAELAYRVWLGAWAVPWPGGGRGQSEPSKADRPHAACHHTSSPCRARGNSAPDCPHHAAIAARRLMFSARHTRCHSPRTLSKPRRLNRRNPSTSLTQPFGPSDIHLRLAY